MSNLFVVYARFADLCGNEDVYKHGVYRAETIEEVQEVFLEGFLVGFQVVPLEVKDLPSTVQQVKAENSY